jgi:hypothetical protein
MVKFVFMTERTGKSKIMYPKDAVECFANASGRADFLTTTMYPDKDALKASTLFEDLCDQLESGTVDMPNLDKKALTYFLNLEGDNDDPMIEQGKAAWGQLREYVASVTGVSVDRIDAADMFWANQFFD